ncbi:MAG: MerR family transcriptional regulator [Actinomycetota bacterium]
MNDDLLTIGELASRTGVATSALRYYEELGLVCSATRVSGHRRYPPEAVGIVGAILFLRDVGFALDEIGQLMDSRATSPGAWRDLARRKLDELDARIHEAQVARIAVEHAIHCPREDIVTCPNFQEVVRQRLAGTPLADVTP